MDQLVIYFLSILIYLKSQQWKIFISCTGAVIAYYCVIFACVPSKVYWHNLYLSLFLFSFSFGCYMVPSNFPCFKIQKSYHKRAFLNVLKMIFLTLFTISMVRILLNYIALEDKSYNTIRVKIGVFDRFDVICFFRLGLFITIYYFVKIKNIVLKFLFLSFVFCVENCTLTKQNFCFICLGIFLFFLIKSIKSFRVSFLKGLILIFSISLYSIFFYWVKGGQFNTSRLSSNIAELSYITLDFAQNFNYCTYGESSFHTLIRNPKFVPKLDKISMNLWHGMDPFYDYAGINQANTPCPVGLYVDFRWFSLIFAFILGFCLQYYDKRCRHIAECINWQLCDTCFFVSYIACILSSLSFCIATVGSAFLAGGVGLMLVLSIVFFKLEFEISKH